MEYQKLIQNNYANSILFYLKVGNKAVLNLSKNHYLNQKLERFIFATDNILGNN